MVIALYLRACSTCKSATEHWECNLLFRYRVQEHHKVPQALALQQGNMAFLLFLFHFLEEFTQGLNYSITDHLKMKITRALT